MIEIRDAQGRGVLQGQFVASPEDEDDIEREAPLKPTGIDPDAAGEAEVEWPKTGGPQEIEFSVRNLAAGTVIRFVIDNQVVGEASVDRRGRAKLEIDLPVR